MAAHGGSRRQRVSVLRAHRRHGWLVGKRTSELNFDWIINVTIGSFAASGILLKNVATADAMTAIKYWRPAARHQRVVQRSRKAADVVKAEPNC